MNSIYYEFVYLPLSLLYTCILTQKVDHLCSLILRRVQPFLHILETWNFSYTRHPGQLKIDIRLFCLLRLFEILGQPLKPYAGG